MDTTATPNNFVKQGQSAADKAADRIQGGIRDAQRKVDHAGDELADRVEDIRHDAAPILQRAVDQTQSFVRQTVKSVGNASRQISDSASQVSDTMISYTKTNPIKALLIATATGAVLVTLIRALTPSRD